MDEQNCFRCMSMHCHGASGPFVCLPACPIMMPTIHVTVLMHSACIYSKAL